MLKSLRKSSKGGKWPLGGASVGVFGVLDIPRVHKAAMVF